MSLNILMSDRELASPVPSHPLQEVCEYLNTIPEYQKLVESIGKVELVVERILAGGGVDFENSRIILDPSLFEKKIGVLYPDAMECVLFEMHNLARKAEFRDVLSDASGMSPDAFVERCERLEHFSGLKTKAIVRRIFAYEDWESLSLVRTPESFVLHYALQKMSGHSKRIWDKYSFLFPKGATYSGSNEVAASEEEARHMLAYISFRNEAADPNSFIANPASECLALLKEYIETNKSDGEESEVLTRMSVRISEIEALMHEEAIFSLKNQF